MEKANPTLTRLYNAQQYDTKILPQVRAAADAGIPLEHLQLDESVMEQATEDYKRASSSLLDNASIELGDMYEGAKTIGKSALALLLGGGGAEQAFTGKVPVMPSEEETVSAVNKLLGKGTVPPSQIVEILPEAVVGGATSNFTRLTGDPVETVRENPVASTLAALPFVGPLAGAAARGVKDTGKLGKLMKMLGKGEAAADVVEDTDELQAMLRQMDRDGELSPDPDEFDIDVVDEIQVPATSMLEEGETAALPGGGVMREAGPRSTPGQVGNTIKEARALVDKQVKMIDAYTKQVTALQKKGAKMGEIEGTAAKAVREADTAIQLVQGKANAAGQQIDALEELAAKLQKEGRFLTAAQEERYMKLQQQMAGYEDVIDNLTTLKEDVIGRITGKQADIMEAKKLARRLQTDKIDPLTEQVMKTIK